jgi:hypothetical protein
MGDGLSTLHAVEGPIGTDRGTPYGSATREGSEESRLLTEFDYVEEEFFVSGTANTYGPASTRPLADDEDLYALEPLSTVCERDVPFTTRVVVVRPRDMRRFSGTVLAIPFHNLGANVQLERNLTRRRDAWVGVEVCSGTRFGADETPSGGVPNLHRTDPNRYGSLVVAGGKPEHWPGLTPGALAHAFETLDFGRGGGDAMKVFRQELYRSYASGPDIYFSVVEALRSGRGGLLPDGEVRRVYTTGASGASEILRPLVEYHHDHRARADGGPILDGYFIRVGQVPVNRPDGAVLIVLQSEAEALTNVESGEPLPDDTDEPRFRYYEIAGTGHRISADPPQTRAHDLAEVLPEGIRGLSQRDESDELEPYDKYNAPILWAIWDDMYAWVDDGVPMPRAPRITRDPSAPDGIARDEHGNALGGIRTPWVDVPDARYVARISPGNPLSAGLRRFTEAEMQTLYGPGDEYGQRVRANVEGMVRDRFLLPEDVGIFLGTSLYRSGP